MELIALLPVRLLFLAYLFLFFSYSNDEKTQRKSLNLSGSLEINLAGSNTIGISLSPLLRDLEVVSIRLRHLDLCHLWS